MRQERPQVLVYCHEVVVTKLSDGRDNNYHREIVTKLFGGRGAVWQGATCLRLRIPDRLFAHSDYVRAAELAVAVELSFYNRCFGCIFS